MKNMELEFLTKLSENNDYGTQTSPSKTYAT